MARRRFMAFVVQQLEIRARKWHANGAGKGFAVGRVAAGRWRGFGKAIAFTNRAAGFLQPEFGHGTLHRHAATERDFQVRPIDGIEVRVVGQPVKQGVDGRKTVHLVLGQLFEHRWQVTRIGDQDVFTASPHPEHHVHGERKNMVQRQRANIDGRLACRQAGHRRDIPGFGLQHVGDHIAVQQHSAFGHAGRAAGVLQHGDVVGLDVGPLQRTARTLRQRVIKAYRVRQVERRHHLLDVAHHIVDQCALEKPQLVAHCAQNDVLHGRVDDALVQGTGKVFDNDDGLGT